MVCKYGNIEKERIIVRKSIHDVYVVKKGYYPHFTSFKDGFKMGHSRPNGLKKYISDVSDQTLDTIVYISRRGMNKRVV